MKQRWLKSVISFGLIIGFMKVSNVCRHLVLITLLRYIEGGLRKK